MERIVLFRFHENPAVCENRLRLVRKMNPDIAIFGLYGGEDGAVGSFSRLSPYLENFFIIGDKSAEWKWKNSDLAARLWLDAVGAKTDFDMLRMIEWDLVLFDSLDNIYRSIPENGIGLTGLTELINIEDKWDWTSVKKERIKYEALFDFARKRYGYEKTPYASLGPGCCLPRKFLADYAAAEVPELCHDELRLPLFGQVLGYQLYDTGFYKKWFDEGEHAYFNCMDRLIDGSTIVGELKKAAGRRVFHPYRNLIDL